MNSRLAVNVNKTCYTSENVLTPVILTIPKNNPSFWVKELETAKIGDRFTIGDSKVIYTFKGKNVFHHTIVTSETGFREINGKLVYIATAYYGYYLESEESYKMIVPVSFDREIIKKVV